MSDKLFTTAILAIVAIVALFVISSGNAQSPQTVGAAFQSASEGAGASARLSRLPLHICQNECLAERRQCLIDAGCGEPLAIDADTDEIIEYGQCTFPCYESYWACEDACWDLL